MPRCTSYTGLGFPSTPSLSLSFNLNQESTSLDAWSPPFWWQTVVWSRSWVRHVTATASVEVTGLWRWWCCLSGRGHQGWEDVRFSSAFLIIHYLRIGCIPPRKVTWNPKMTRLKREIIFQISILRFHFFLWGVYVCIFVMCTYCKYTSRLCCRL